MRIALTSKKLLAIEWDAQELRVVSVRPRLDGIDILKAVSTPIPPDVPTDDAERFGAFLREALSRSRIGGKRVLLMMPRDQVVLNNMNLPPTPEEELPAIVQFQIVKELPFAVDQAVLDYAVSGVFDPKSASNVLVAAVRNEQLAFYRRVAKEAGLTIERIGLRPHANLIAVTAKWTDAERSTLLVISVGPQLTEIDIIREGVLEFSRAASVALPAVENDASARVEDSRIIAPPIQEREPDAATGQAIRDLMVEIIRSYEAYRATDPSISLSRAVVGGSSGLEGELAVALSSRFGVETELYRPDRALNLSPQRAKELRGFSAVLGLALGQGMQERQCRFDFLHPKKPVSKKTLRLKKVPVAVATICLFIASGVIVHVKQIRPMQQQVALLEKQVAPKKDQVEAIDRFKKRVDALEAWQKSERYWPEVLVALTQAFPSDEIAFSTRLDFEAKPKKKSAERLGFVRVKLRTAALGVVNDLSATLRELGFEEVAPGKETRASRTGDARYRFDTSVEAHVPLRSALRAGMNVEGLVSKAGEVESAEDAGAEDIGKEAGDAQPEREGGSNDSSEEKAAERQAAESLGEVQEGDSEETSRDAGAGEEEPPSARSQPAEAPDADGAVEGEAP